MRAQALQHGLVLVAMVHSCSTWCVCVCVCTQRNCYWIGLEIGLNTFNV